MVNEINGKQFFQYGEVPPPRGGQRLLRRFAEGADLVTPVEAIQW